MSGSERRRELRRRRHRKKKVAKLLDKATKGSASDKEVIVHKLRNLTPGADIIIAAHGIIK
ncbi:MAG: DUF6800 family protein [Pirellulaceae bacterium]